jgi:eukaryotic-like serine/threonine-protein kinase
MWDAGTALLLDNRYQLDQQIASGQFSDIWRGTDVVLARPVAVKLLRAGVAADAPEMARFRTAARHAGLLAHENVARVYDYDESGGSHSDGSQPPFMMMEFVDGPSLAAVLAGGSGTPAADPYSLGMVAYQCLAGSPPLGTPAVGRAPGRVASLA